jgi:hypothetical protein
LKHFVGMINNSKEMQLKIFYEVKKYEQIGSRRNSRENFRDGHIITALP